MFKGPFMRISFLRPSILTGLALFACWGCTTSTGSPAQGLVPVKGKVTYKGQPLTKGVVEFEPRGSGRLATGKIGSDGTFVLSTFRDGDGAVAGHHRVSITGTGTKATKELVPVKYVSAMSSGLGAEVSPERTEFNFDLK
jgi:hypothetical protein